MGVPRSAVLAAARQCGFRRKHPPSYGSGCEDAMADERGAPFEKEVVRLPDGRQLIYYRFPSPAPRPEPGAPPPERREGRPERKG
jgi:hypothetical protein